MVPSIPSAAPNALTKLTPERIAEIKDLLRYESSIAFYSHRAKESMLLLVSAVEQLTAERSEVGQKARAELAAKTSQPDVVEHGIRMPNGDVTLKRHTFPHDWERMVDRGGVHVSRTIHHGEWIEAAS